MNVREKRELLDGVEKRCAYCGITEEECADFFTKNPQYTRAGKRGYHLEVDRIDSSKAYTKDNVVWACYPCNNSKSNYCNSAEAFKPIAAGIKQVWKNNGYNPK